MIISEREIRSIKESLNNITKMDSRFPKQEDWAMSDSDEEETTPQEVNAEADSSDEETKEETFPIIPRHLRTTRVRWTLSF